MTEDTLCKRYRPYFGPFADGVLEPALRHEVRLHLASCDACRADLQALDESKRVAAASYYEVEVPSNLWSRIQTDLRRAADERASGPQLARRWAFVNGGAFLAIGMLAAGVWIDVFSHAVQPRWPDLPAKELRAFIDSGRPVDVAVNDPQKLREWFRPRIAFELPPLDVRSISFNGVRLVGGRLCYFFDRRIASYMFSVDGRILSLYVMESGGLPEVPTNAFTNRQGTAPIVHVADLSELFWGDEGLMYFLVGELPAPDLARLAEQLRRPKQSGNVRIGQTRSS